MTQEQRQRLLECMCRLNLEIAELENISSEIDETKIDRIIGISVIGHIADATNGLEKLLSNQ